MFGVQALDPSPNYAKLSEELNRGGELSRLEVEAERLWKDRRDIDGGVVPPSSTGTLSMVVASAATTATG